MSAHASFGQSNPDGSTSWTDDENTPGGAPGAQVTRDANGVITNVDLDGTEAWQQRQNEAIAQSGFDAAATGNPALIKYPAAPNPPPGVVAGDDEDGANSNYSD
jgi:hypothetical protein